MSIVTRRILIVEDDTTLSLLLQKNLTYEGFSVECVADGSVAVTKALETRPDLMILDITVPSLDGFRVCQRLSRERDRIPIIMLTARTQAADKVQGLESGADDYVTKPFMLDELIARIHAVLRRARPIPEILKLGDVVVDFNQRTTARRGQSITLTPREYAILHRLAERPGTVVSREDLLTSVWGYREAPLTRAVDIVMARLRRKVETDPRHPRFLLTSHRDGYYLSIEA